MVTYCERKKIPRMLIIPRRIVCEERSVVFHYVFSCYSGPGTFWDMRRLSWMTWSRVAWPFKSIFAWSRDDLRLRVLYCQGQFSLLRRRYSGGARPEAGSHDSCLIHVYSKHWRQSICKLTGKSPAYCAIRLWVAWKTLPHGSLPSFKASWVWVH